jgi:hypothetical protein
MTSLSIADRTNCESCGSSSRMVLMVRKSDTADFWIKLIKGHHSRLMTRSCPTCASLHPPLHRALAKVLAPSVSYRVV